MKKINIKIILISIIAICTLILVWYVTIKPLLLNKTPEFETYNKLFNDNNKIALNSDTYSIISKSGTNKDNKTNLNFEFSGTDTIWEIESMKETKVTLSFKSKIENGKYKLVLITPSNDVITLCNKSSKKNKEITLKPGKTKIKMVGLSAKGNLNLEIKPSNNKDILHLTPITKGIEENKAETK